MGCKSSKISVNEPLPVIDATADGSEIIIESEDRYDRQVIGYIKNELTNRPERFILNNLLMSIVFFRNYEKDLYDFSNTAIPKEELELNAKLVTEVKKCILSDALLDKIQENIQFGDQDDEHKEPISHKTIYVINNNIEVKDKNDETFYTSIEVPGCQVKIEDFSDDPETRIFLQGNKKGTEGKRVDERKGFLKLRVLGSYSSNMEPTQFTNRSLSVPSQKENSKPPIPNVEKFDLGDEYSTITAFKTPRDLNIVRRSGRRDTLPDICFEMRKIRKFETNVIAEEKENEQEGNENEQEENEEDDISDNEETIKERQKRQSELYEDVTYLSSKGFMEYFQNDVFPNTTSKILGFSEKDIESAQVVPGCILCNKHQNGKAVPYQVIPAVTIDWPTQATEYALRKSRKTIIDKRDGIVYKWPTNEMVRELKTLNCVVIPKGFVMKKGENENSDIEWEIHFPKASRYLAMRMSHPQVRCYVFLLTLYKTYIEKYTTHHGLLIEHIKAHMFWECEADAKNWPEHKMGIKILQVIADLNSGLSRCKIPHYFIKGKNIFENIPSKYLQFAQKVLHDIIQFPVMHFLNALKNLRYINSDFYPAPDLDQLYSLLTKKKAKLPSRVRRSQANQKPRKSVVPVGSQRQKQNRRIQDLKWKKKNEKNNRKKFLEQEKQKEEQEAEKAEKVVVEEKNLKLVISSMDIITQISVLQFFTQHFIEIAKKSRTIGPKSQTLFYLKQAWYNMKVLEDIGGTCSDTEDIEKIIATERDMLERQNESEEEIAPPTPHRNADHNVFVFHDNSGKSGAVKSSFKTNSQGEIASRNREKRLMRINRPKSVGFDDNVEKITFLKDM